MKKKTEKQTEKKLN